MRAVHARRARALVRVDPARDPREPCVALAPERRDPVVAGRAVLAGRRLTLVQLRPAERAPVPRGTAADERGAVRQADAGGGVMTRLAVAHPGPRRTQHPVVPHPTDALEPVTPVARHRRATHGVVTTLVRHHAVVVDRATGGAGVADGTAAVEAIVGVVAKSLILTRVAVTRTCQRTLS